MQIFVLLPKFNAKPSSNSNSFLFKPSISLSHDFFGKPSPRDFVESQSKWKENCYERNSIRIRRIASAKRETRKQNTKTLIKLCRRVCVVLIKTDSFLACAHRVHLRECFEEEVRCQIATNQKPSNRSSFNFITIFFLLSFPDLRLPHHHHHYSNNRSIHAGQRRKRSRSRTTNVLVM
jgi:hypothetical protein